MIERLSTKVVIDYIEMPDRVEVVDKINEIIDHLNQQEKTPIFEESSKCPACRGVGVYPMGVNKENCKYCGGSGLVKNIYTKSNIYKDKLNAIKKILED